MIGIQNPSSTDKDWNPVPGIRNPQRGIQNPRLSRIPLHGAKHCTSTRTEIIEHRIKKRDLTNGIDWDIQNEQHEICPHAKIQLARKLLVEY